MKKKIHSYSFSKSLVSNTFFICGHGGEAGEDSWKCLMIQTQDILPETEISTEIINNSVAFPCETEEVR